MIMRRKLIHGMALATAAPLAGQLASRALAMEAGTAQPGMVFYFFPEGTWPDNFFPSAGRITTLPVMSEPLTPWIDRLKFIDGLAHYGDAGHEAEAYTLAAGDPTSIDNLIAQQVTADTQEPVLRMGVLSNYWANKNGNSRIDGQEQPVEDSPVALYSRLFGAGPTGTDANLSGVKNTAGAQVAQQVEQQLNTLAGIQTALTGLAVPPLNLRGRFKPTTNFSNLSQSNGSSIFSEANLLAILDIQQDIAAMALALGITRNLNFMVGHEYWPVRVASLPGTAVEIAHIANGQTDIASPSNVQVRWHMAAYARLLAKLAALPAAGGSVLDNTFCLSYSNMGLMNVEHQRRIPYVLAGGQNFGHIGGRSLDFRNSSTGACLPHSQLLTSLGQKMGANISSFGNSDCWGGHDGGPLQSLWDKV